MKKHRYDTSYVSEHVFGKQLQTIATFFRNYPDSLEVWDLGAGQGRDTLALAAFGHSLVAVDESAVGLQQIEANATKLKKDDDVILILRKPSCITNS